MRKVARKYFPLIFGLLISVSLTACSPIRQFWYLIEIKALTPSERYIHEGDQLMSEDRFAEALLSYRQAVILDPNDSKALVKLGSAYAMQGRNRMAERYLRQASQIEPDNVEIISKLSGLTLNFPDNNLQHLWHILLFPGTPTGFDFAKNIIAVAFEEGQLSALDSQKVAVHWQIQLEETITSPPSISSQLVLVGGQSGTLYALSLADGSIVWKFKTSAPIYAKVVSDEKYFFCASNDGNLYKLDVKGNLIWTFTSRAGIRSPVAIQNQIVFVGSSDSFMYAVDAQSGTPVWQNGIQTQGAIESTAVVLQDRLFFGSDDSRLYAVSVATGGEYWRYSTPDAIYASPVIYDDIIYAASSGNLVAALDILTGEPLWETYTPVPLYDAPAVDNKYLFFAGPGNASIFAIDKNTGNIIWQYDTGDWMIGSPKIWNHTLFSLGKDGTLIAFKPMP